MRYSRLTSGMTRATADFTSDTTLSTRTLGEDGDARTAAVTTSPASAFVPPSREIQNVTSISAVSAPRSLTEMSPPPSKFQPRSWTWSRTFRTMRWKVCVGVSPMTCVTMTTALTA